MCASYGIDFGIYGRGVRPGFAPLSTPSGRVRFEQWGAESGGKASITRRSRRGVNLNPVVLQRDGARVLELAWWWFHVAGRPAPYTAFNSRDDTLLEKWRSGLRRRALLPATWYSEGGKRWVLPDGELFGIAAITAPRALGDVPGGVPDGVPGGAGGPRDGIACEGVSYSMVTRAGVGEAATVLSSRGESRMPLVLPREMHDAWLDPERAGDAALVAQAVRASEEISRELTSAGQLTLF
ncbi:MAG: DUF159 family protein [Actinobacteria bacterium]|nr:DUF159 family protein [Actinomycetota bacterium]